MVNKANVLKVIEAIENGVEFENLGFNMAGFKWKTEAAAAQFGTTYTDKSGRGCGTVACIAGWATSLSTYERRHTPLRVHEVTDFDIIAQDYLGIERGQAEALFYGEGARHSLDEITAEEALGTLCHLAETGDVNWEEGEARADAKRDAEKSANLKAEKV